MLSVLACDSGGSNQESGVDYLDSWKSEMPLETSVAWLVDVGNGQTDTIKTEGEVTVFLEFVDGGPINLTYDFISMSPPLCSPQAPCSMQSIPGDELLHQYIGKQLTPEGLRASYIKIITENSSDFAHGYVYVSEDRLCISNGLWDFFVIKNENSATDPMATDFTKCFVRNSQS